MVTLEQLAAYLPYKLECVVDGKKAVLNAVYSDGTCVFCGLVESNQGFNSIKPVLKPLMDIDFKELMNNTGIDESSSIYGCIELIRITYRRDLVILTAPYQVIKWCLANHYDVFGLIEKGDAVREGKGYVGLATYYVSSLNSRKQ